MYCGIAPQRASVWRRASSLPTGWTSASDVTIASQPPPVCAMLQSSYRQTRVAIEPSSASRMTPYEMPSGRPAGGVGSIATSSASQARSEEHTSELSRLHLVCRLLLEKKKNIFESAAQLYFDTHGRFTLHRVLNFRCDV